MVKEQPIGLEQTIAAARGIPALPVAAKSKDLAERFQVMSSLVVLWERGRRWAKPVKKRVNSPR